MPLLPNPEKWREEGLLALLHALPEDIPGVLDAQKAASAGNRTPWVFIQEAWQQFRQQRERESTQLAALYNELQLLKQTIELYRTGPIAQELQSLRKSTSQLEQRAQTAERNLTTIENTTQRELDDARQEITRLQALVIEQNRTITHQHLQLEALMSSSDEDSA